MLTLKFSAAKPAAPGLYGGSKRVRGAFGKEPAMFRVAKEATFAAAHHLRHYHGRCENLHGHNWRVQVVVEGQSLGDDGILVDFTLLKRALNEVLDGLDHHDLNTLPPFIENEPSAENLAQFIAGEVGKRINTNHAHVCQVNVWETEHSVASFIVEAEQA